MRRTLRERINGLLVGDRTYPIILVIVVQLIGVNEIERNSSNYSEAQEIVPSVSAMCYLCV
jgi:hypothetical protein